MRQLEEEAQWILESKANPQAFARLYDRYAPNIYRYLLSRLGNVAGAQDVTSQTFLSAFEMFPRYRHQGYFSAWLFAIARSKYVDYLRKTKNRSGTSIDHIQDPQEDLLQGVIHSERLAELKKVDQQAFRRGAGTAAPAFCGRSEFCRNGLPAGAQ